jgi:acyl-CoA synthetase (AMP-forming)/AMP-acid ligase II
VIEHCRAHLPAPKVPKRAFILAELPKSDRGKVLRDKLKDDWRERTKLPA